MNEQNELETLKECPYCAEMIAIKAKKCKHCGELLDPVLRELDILKKQNLVINNNNNNNNNNIDAPIIVVAKKNYPWLGHLFMTLISGGFWIIPWVLFYIFRDKRIYN